MPVEIRCKRTLSSRVPRDRLRLIAERTLRTGHAKAQLTIYITDDAEMRALNRRFHATDATTDVLSFPAAAGGDRRVTPLQGDIAISYDQARRQARAAGWRIGDELTLLVVHGVLHLLGYDDLTPRARATMWRQQEKILGRIPGS